MWLGEQVTSRGVGNGISLIIFAGIVAELPSALAGTLELGRQGALSTFIILALIIMVVVVIAFIVFMERAQRRLWCNIRNAKPPPVWRRAIIHICRSSSIQQVLFRRFSHHLCC